MDGFFGFLARLGYTHPVHPTMISVIIGLIAGAFLLGVGALFRSEAALGAKQMLLLAFLFIFPTAASAYLDWYHFFGGAWVYPFHIKMGLALLLFVLLLAGVVIARGRRSRSFPLSLLAICTLAWLDAMTLGFFGGQAVFGQQAPREAAHRGGELTFRYNCSGCHPFGGNHIAPRHAVIGSDRIASAPVLTAWIRSPNPPMPDFPATRIADERAGALQSYLQALWGEEKGPGSGEGQGLGRPNQEGEGQGQQQGNGAGNPPAGRE